MPFDIFFETQYYFSPLFEDLKKKKLQTIYILNSIEIVVKEILQVFELRFILFCCSSNCTTIRIILFINLKNHKSLSDVIKLVNLYFSHLFPVLKQGKLSRREVVQKGSCPEEPGRKMVQHLVRISILLFYAAVFVSALTEMQSKRRFVNETYAILLQMPQKDVCQLFRNISRSSSVDMANYYNQWAHKTKNKQRCALKSSERAPATVSSLHRLLARLYNMLPIAFQCSVLQGVVVETPDCVTRQNQSFKDVLQNAEEVILLNFPVMRSARQCGKIILKEHDAYTNILEMRFYRRKPVAVSRIRDKMRVFVPEALEHFVSENNVSSLTRPSFSGHMRFFLNVQKESESIKHLTYTIHVRVFLSVDGEPPQSAHLISAAVHNYKLAELESALQVSLRMAPVDTEIANVGKSIRFERFPASLLQYFKRLTVCKQCAILQNMATYMQRSFQDVISKLSDEGLVTRYHCKSNKRREGVHKFIEATKTKTPPPLHRVQRVTNSKLTFLEITTLVCLASLVVFAAIFFATLGVYVKRRRRLMRVPFEPPSKTQLVEKGIHGGCEHQGQTLARMYTYIKSPLSSLSEQEPNRTECSVTNLSDVEFSRLKETVL